MKYELLGTKTGLYASKMVLGTAMLGNRSGYGSTAQDAQAILQRYAAMGGNFIDTADTYQHGEAEEIVGKFIEADRNNYIICSKYTRTSHAQPAIANKGNHRKAMVQAVHASLKRLRTDHIDIYMPHYDDGVTPMEEIVRGLEDLQRAGKIIYAGLANYPAWKAATIATLAAEQKMNIAAMQYEYNLLQRTPDREILPMASHFGMGSMLYSPLAGGLLTGKYRSGATGRMTRMGKDGEQDVTTNAVLDELHTTANELDTLPGQVALAWMIARSGFTIIGARNLEQLESNLKATTIELSNEQLKRLDDLSVVSLGYPHELLAAQQGK